MALMLLMTTTLMADGRFTVGDFALFVAYLEPVTNGIRAFGKLATVGRQTTVSLKRLLALLQNAPPEKLTDPTPMHLHGRYPDLPYTPRAAEHRLDALQVSGLSYRYPGNGSGIHNIDLHLPRGSFTVITGRTGSGKSTLLKSVVGILPKDAGEIRWNGELVVDPGAFLVPPRCAYTG
jgi:ATP-binding cassette subfamily B protein